MRQLQISRRTMLRGVGTAIGLPFLEAMLPRTLLAAPAAKAPLRAAFFYIPVGANMEAWRQPKTPGLPETLEQLKKLAGSIIHITGLQHRNAEGLGDGAGDHARDGGTFLTGMHPKKTDGKDIMVGPSADQIIAQQVGSETRFPSLELGTDGGAQSGNCDSGYSCAYSSNISWRTGSQPNAKETSPRNLFIRLFGDPKARASEAEIAREASYTRSILDMVNEDSKKLRGRLGTTDQGKLDEYLEGLRAVEKQVQGAEKMAATPPPNIELPSGAPADHGDHIKLLCEILAAAFQTDSTRVATMMLANSGSNRTFPSIGVTEGHHTISHHAGDKAKLEKLKKIDKYYIELFAAFLEKLKSVKEERGTLLDNSIIVYGGALSDPNRHNHDDLPVIVAGKGGGTLASGRFLKMQGQPMCSLFLSIFDRMKVKAVQFGDTAKRAAL
ncbi:MAG: DUF1552 domain-containing protein [Planctomycetes bacterium]|nr:DUF1552 domain-containing protein [Planctomycetota bacterium]